MLTLLMKTYWIILLVALLGGFLFLGTMGLPLTQTPVVKVVTLS